jgi:hypothetical protein
VNAAGRAARIVALPVGQRPAVAAGSELQRAERRQVDDWGRDPTAVAVAGVVAGLRWDTTVGGVEHLAPGGALIVVNQRRGALAPLHAALAVGRATRRAVRFVGRPDIAPLGPLAQRLGGLLGRPDEVAGALRGGALVVLPAAPTLDPRAVGRVDHHLVGAAVATRVPVHPAVVLSSPLRRAARIEIGAARRPGRHRRGPLAELELADDIERDLRLGLEELGTRTGTPLDWLPWMGGP